MLTRCVRYQNWKFLLRTKPKFWKALRESESVEKWWGGTLRIDFQKLAAAAAPIAALFPKDTPFTKRFLFRHFHLLWRPEKRDQGSTFSSSTFTTAIRLKNWRLKKTAHRCLRLAPTSSNRVFFVFFCFWNSKPFVGINYLLDKVSRCVRNEKMESSCGWWVAEFRKLTEAARENLCDVIALCATCADRSKKVWIERRYLTVWKWKKIIVD